MKAYKVKNKKLTGSGFHEIRCKAFIYHRNICRQTRRRPYVRSIYFNREKVFISLFWDHLFKKKNWRDRIRRMRYFPAAIELIRTTRLKPQSKINPNKSSEILHRFTGLTSDHDLFHVQI